MTLLIDICGRYVPILFIEQTQTLFLFLVFCNIVFWLFVTALFLVNKFFEIYKWKDIQKRQDFFWKSVLMVLYVSIPILILDFTLMIFGYYAFNECFIRTGAFEVVNNDTHDRFSFAEVRNKPVFI